MWDHKHFPFGICFSQPLSAKFRRRLRNGRYTRYTTEDRNTLINLFASGDLTAFESIIVELQSALGAKKPFLERLGLMAQLPTNEVPESDNSDLLDMLALGYFASGKLELAKTASDAADDARRRVNQKSYSSNTYAINYFVKANLSIAHGDMKGANEFAKKAWELHPEYQVLTQFLWTLTGIRPKSNGPMNVGAPFPVNYCLENFDPVNEITGHGKLLSLNATLEAMDRDQILVMLIYGGYRSNYYGNIDIERLALLHAACPRIISEVHVICSSDYALSSEHRRYAEGLAERCKLPITILWDQDNSVMAEMGGGGSPVRAVVNKCGQVLSTAPLAEERGFWEALEMMKVHAS